MEGRSLIKIAGALLSLLCVLPTAAQLPALPKIEVPSLEQVLPAQAPAQSQAPAQGQATPAQAQTPAPAQALNQTLNQAVNQTLNQAVNQTVNQALNQVLPAQTQGQAPAQSQAPAQTQSSSQTQTPAQAPALDQQTLNQLLPVLTQALIQARAQEDAAAQAQTGAPTQTAIQAPTPTPEQQLPAQAPIPGPEQQLPAQPQLQVPVLGQAQAPIPDPAQVPAAAQVPVLEQAQLPTPNPEQAPLTPQSPAAAQPVTATFTAVPPPNTDQCDMSTLDSQAYPRATVRDIQERLHRIYSRDPQWPASEEQGALRLTDGLLGPVTRSWMERFCRDFQLQRRGDIITLLPLRAVAIAVFADRFMNTFASRLEERGLPETVSVLTSADFAAWLSGLRASEQAAARDTLSGGPDTELLALINRYLGPLQQVVRPEEPDTLYVLREDDLAALQVGGEPLPAEVLAMLKPMQDLEFPERELLHYAAQNHLINNLGLCVADLAEAEDIRPALLTAEQYRALGPWLGKTFPLLATLRADDELPSVPCFRFPYEDFAAAYTAAGLGDAIETAAAEKMPEYTHTPILWNGEDCGCTPPELESTAYGVYPYWKATGMVQNFDFSMFSRIGYFGLQMNDSGQLQQIRGADANTTLLNDTGRDALDFIDVAHTYGSKVDWMIERDWSRTQDGAALAIRTQLENLRADIVQLLDRRPAEPLVALRPLLSLGLAGRPLNGDGVTLYFKNFPNDPEAQLEFENFFHSLKDELRRLSDEHNRFHQVEQNLYLNLVVSHDDFIDPASVFSGPRLEQLLNVESVVQENLSVIETQERMNSVILLLLDEPYYASLDDLYMLTHETSRALILPLLISDYRDMKDSSPIGGMVLDSRTKKLDYLYESFGGAAFWPIPERAEDGPGRYEGFENYLTRKFAPGATGSWWTDTVCAWRWPLIGVINTWLVLAFTLIAVAFFLYPMNCRRMPWLLKIATRPVSLALILIPPTLAWFYLLVEDPLLTPFWYPYAATLLVLIIAALIGRALYMYMLELRRRKPARVAGYDPRRLAAGRRTQALDPAAPAADDDADLYGESFTAD